MDSSATGLEENKEGPVTGNGTAIAVVNATEKANAVTALTVVADSAKVVHETGDQVDAVSAALPADAELEEIGGFKVHPLASLFPLIVGKEFDDLVEAAARARRLQAVEVHNGLLIDGRNRVRVQEELRRRNIEIDLPVVAWEPSGEETVEQHIWSVNANRRHLTDDQRAAIGISFLPFIRRRCQERQAATRFGQREAAAQISSPPGAPTTAERTSREKDEASTVGQFATMFNIGKHKARQAVAINDGVEAGEISSIEIVAIAAGSKRLRDVVPTKRSSGRKKAVDKESPRPEAELIVDAELIEADEPVPTESEVRERWERLKQSFAVTDHRELRRLLKQIIVEEQRQFDQ